MLHRYKKKETVKCLKGKRVIYMGDSTSRKAFFGAVRAINTTAGDFDNLDDKHKDWKYDLEGVSYEFIWDPLMKDRALKFLQSYEPSTNGTDIAYVYISFGMWFPQEYQKPDSPNPFEELKKTLDKLALVLEKDTEQKFNKVILSPVFEPYYPKLQGQRKTGLTPDRISKCNQVLTQVFPVKSTNVYVAHVFNTFANNKTEYFDSEGIHFTDPLANLQSDIASNMVCNNVISDTFPYANTCCLDYPKPSFGYALFLWSVLIILPVGLLTYNFSKVVGAKAAAAFNNASSGVSKFYESLLTAHGAIITFAICLAYCYLCDRTQTFGKGNKNFVWSEFNFLSLIALVIGLLTMRSVSDAKQQTFLNRHQTDEWKGWMQIAILIYHITGASKVLPIYKCIRVMVASYLFMTGYGHTAFFVKKGDFGLKRVVSVLCRLNLLTIFLAYVMNTNYIFYYFSPLVTFWFGVIWLTYRILPQYNAGLKSSLIKVTISGLLAYAFVAIPGPFEGIFWFLKNFCRIDWNLTEWRFRVLLDIWAVHFGMITSILVNNPEMSSIHERLVKLKWAMPLIGGFLCIVYWFASGLYDVKTEYNSVNKYLSLIPITGFILMRNSAPVIGYYSKFFAWFGKISLETFILQFHIWMAADTKGVLYMIDMGFTDDSSLFRITNETYQKILYNYHTRHYLNFILITIPFLIASEKTSSASGVLTSWIVSPEKFLENAPTKPSLAQGGGEEAVELKSLEEGTDITAEPPVTYSSSPTVRLLQKIGRVFGLLILDLRVRLGLILVTLWFINLSW